MYKFTRFFIRLFISYYKRPLTFFITFFLKEFEPSCYIYQKLNYKLNYFLFDYIFFFFFILKKKIYMFKIDLKEKQLNYNFYSKYKKLFNYGGLYYFYKTFYLWIRLWIISLLLFVVICYYFLIFRSLPFNKIVFQWFIIIMVAYWIVSGFVFFLKKYRFSKFTSAIQRFWRRSFMIFWLIESFLFLIFLYLTLNANNESTFMFDNIQIYKTHLFSWRWFLLKIFPLTILVLLSYFFLISFKWLNFSKLNLLLLLFTLLLLYILWLEFYQFFHVLNFYGNLNWVYNNDEHLWILESDFKKTRIVNHYVTICVIAKFWHLIFIFLFWVFFILRSNEFNRYRYPFFSANFQNFIMLYILSWIYMYPWIKFLFRRYLDNPYYWFYVNLRKNFFRLFFNDIKLFYFGFQNIFFDKLLFFKNELFFYFISSSNFTSYYQYKKNILRDYFILNILND